MVYKKFINRILAEVLVTHIINGKEIAQNLRDSLKKEIATLKHKHNAVPGLAVVQVGNVAASSVYVKAKTKNANEVGIKVIDHHLEEEITQDQLLELIDGTSISCSFSHIFAGGYSAGYYSYKWAEVLDADAFEKFKEDGIFNKETAKSFRENILSKGNLENPKELYMKFRGAEPSTDALLKREGLIQYANSIDE